MKKKLKKYFQSHTKTITALFVILAIIIFAQNISSIQTISFKSQLAAISDLITKKNTQNYYIDSVNGDDAASGTSPETAWKTLARLMKTEGVLGSGTNIYLKRASVWHESLRFSSWHINSSSPRNPHITITDYGNKKDPAPVIKGSKIIEGDWKEYEVVNDGKTKIWTTIVNNFDPSTDLFSNLFLQGTSFSQARYPDTGSIRISSWGTRTGLNLASETFGVNQSSDPIFKNSTPGGASLYIRRNHWWIQRHPIESFDRIDNKITVGAPANDPFWSVDNANWKTGTFAARPGYGYFYKNHLAGLNLFGEWVFLDSTKRLYVGFPSSSASPINEPLAFGSQNGIEIYSNDKSKPFSVTIENISIQETGGDAIYVEGVVDINIENVLIQDIGQKGINILRPQKVFISNSNIHNTFLNAINISSNFLNGNPGDLIENIAIEKNTLSSNGQLETQKVAGMTSMSAIKIAGVRDLSIISNKISESGANAISLGNLHKEIILYKNSIKGFSRVLNDTGAIHINGSQNSPEVDIKLTLNLIEGNAPELTGLPEGTESAAPCIYLDVATSNAKVRSNNLKNCHSKQGAININSGSNNKIELNKIMQGLNYPTIGFSHWHKNMIDPGGKVTNGVTNNMEGNFVGQNTLCTLLMQPIPQENLTSEEVQGLMLQYLPEAAKTLIQIDRKTILPGGSLYYDTHQLPVIGINTISDDCK